jgi:hypothetical protein
MDSASNFVVAWLERALDYIGKNKKQVLVGVAGIVVFTAAATGYWFYKIHVRERAHKALLQALKYYDGSVGKIASADAGAVFFSSEFEKWQKTQSVFKEVYENYKGTSLAPIFLAYESEAMLNLGKHDEAVAILVSAVAKMENSAVRDFYRVKLALMQLDSKKEQDQQLGLTALKLIADNAKSAAHEAALYQLGAYYWSEKKFIEAKSYWQILLVKYGVRDAKNLSPYAEKVKEKLSLLSVERL